MTVVAAWRYREGRRERTVSLDEGPPPEGEVGVFDWIGLHDPAPDELARLQQAYGLHPLAVEDAVKGGQLPKIDVYGEQLFVVARPAYLEAGRIRHGETALFVGPRHLISVRQDPRPHGNLRAQLEASPRLLAQGVDYVLHGLLDFVVDGYQPLMQAIEEEVLAMEQRALDSFLGRDDIARLFELRRDLIRFQRIVGPAGEVAGRLARVELPCVDAETRPYFSDVLDHVQRVQTTIDDLRDIATSVFEFSSLLEQQRTGAITRKLAAWAAILAVPTAIAGIYGMNFTHMPELDRRWGYPAVLAAIAAICLTLHRRFRRLGWL